MFTGLIEEKGIVKQISPSGKGLTITIQAEKIFDDLKVGDSVNINGACQTVVNINKLNFTVDTIEETIKKTNLGTLRINENVNLERSIRADSRLGGHFVLGHIDTTGIITGIQKLTNSHSVKISFPEEFGKYLVRVGSVAIDGISLTAADVEKSSFTVAIIPHTWQETNLNIKKTGDTVNLEFDILGKYIAKFLGLDKDSKLSEEWLKELGY